MGCMKTFVILTSVIVIGLSVYLYTPIPDGVSEPWKVRSILAAGKIIKLMCIGSEMIGYSSCLNITRSSINMMLPSDPPSKSDPFLKVTDTTFDGIKVRIYRPKDAQTPSPAMVYFHGGGWTTGSIDATDTFTAELAKLAHIVVVSVQYRLAPEFPFPIPFEDCVTATLHLLHNHEQYGVHGKKIAVGGDSAGGNLAAAVTLLMSSNENLPSISFQLLISPPLQPLNFKLPSYINPENHLTLTPYIMAQQWALYMGPSSHPDLPRAMLDNLHTSPTIKKSHYHQLVNVSFYDAELGPAAALDLDSGNETLWKEIEKKLLNPYMSPLIAHEVYKVPSTIMVTTQFDPLHDEAVMFMERLREKSVQVIHKNFVMLHGTTVMNNVLEASKNATRDIAEDIRIMFSNTDTTETPKI